VTVPGFIEHGTVGRAPTIPGLYRARYRRACSDDPGVYRARYRRVLRPGVYHRSPGATHRLTLAPRPPSPPSYAMIPGRLPPPSYATIPRGDPVDGGDPRPLHARPPGRRHRLTTPVDTFLTVLQGDPPGRLPSLTVSVLRGDPRPPATVLRSSSARRLPRLTRRSPGRPAVLRPPSYDPRLPRDPRRRDPAFLAA